MHLAHFGAAGTANRGMFVQLAHETMRMDVRKKQTGDARFTSKPGYTESERELQAGSDAAGRKSESKMMEQSRVERRRGGWMDREAGEWNERQARLLA